MQPLHTPPQEPQGRCIGCGCTEARACWDFENDQPCHWLRLDRASGEGVCSACPEFVHDFDADENIEVTQ